MCVDVEPGIRTAAAVAWEAAAKISPLALALYFSIEGVAAPGVAVARAAAVPAAAAGVAAWLGVHGPEAAVPRNPDGKNQRKTNN